MGWCSVCVAGAYCLQDTDSLVRDAACEALAAYAWALADAAGSSLPGNSSCPVVKLIFECLAEQKKEAQHGASQALLMVRLRSSAKHMIVLVAAARAAAGVRSPPGSYAACVQQ